MRQRQTNKTVYSQLPGNVYKSVKGRREKSHTSASRKLCSLPAPKPSVRFERNFLRGYLLFDGQHDAVQRVDVFQAVSNRVWLPRKKILRKTKSRFPSPITQKLQITISRKQRQRNGRARYTRELGRLDFSENRNTSKKVGQNRKNVNILSRKSRGKNKKRLYVRLKWKRKNHFLPTKDIANRKTDCTQRQITMRRIQ